MTFFLSGLSFGRDTMEDELSYTQDQTWFNQKKGWSEVSQSRQRQPWRQATWEERVSQFISAVRKGDRKAFLFVEYPLLDGYKSAQGYPIEPSIEKERVGDRGNGRRASLGVIWKMYFEAKRNNTSVSNWLTQGDAKVRANVVKATLAGLFNKDPRVRLVAVNLLRRLRPDPSMARDVKRALVLETVTTERSKWRLKDIDVPSIENPRLGWGAVAWRTGQVDRNGQADFSGSRLTEFRSRYRDGLDDGISQLLDGNGKGRYLTEGLYQKTERNDFPVAFPDVDHRSEKRSSVERRVWTKASLLRYGADEHESGFEVQYGYKRSREVMPKYVYSYVDYRDPATERVGESVYTAYHSVWEEMKKLDLFITRAVWTNRIKRGDVNSLRFISKDTFRSLADQIDGESLENVPMKSPGFKVFGEPEYRAVIVGMLENRVVSTREECIRFLKRLFGKNTTSVATKREIKKALREARRRELIIDTIRGRHVHSELVVPREADDWWGERDEVDVNAWGGTRGTRLQRYRNQVEFPEESDIIYHDRRKPGQEDDLLDDDMLDDDDDAGSTTTTSGDAKTEEKSGGESAEKIEEEKDSRIGHPLLTKSKITFEDVENYLRVDSIIKDKQLVHFKAVEKKDAGTTETKPAETTTPAETEDDDDLLDDDIEVSSKRSSVRPGQSPGYRATPVPADNLRPVTARYYERVRAIETLHSMLLGDGTVLLKAPFIDVQNAFLIWMKLINNERGAVTDVKDIVEDDFLWYLLAGANAISGNEGTRFHDHKSLDLEVGKIDSDGSVAAPSRGARAASNLANLWEMTKDRLGARLQQGHLSQTKEELGKYRAGYYDDIELNASKKAIDAPVDPGKSGSDDLFGIGASHRDTSEATHGKFYGHGRGGYYKFYDQQFRLDQAASTSADTTKKMLGFYQFPAEFRNARKKLVHAFLVGLGDKDPQKRLLYIHMLRRLIPDASMLPRVNKLLRELETVDRRPYKYFDTITWDPNNPAVRSIKRQEKIVGHELLKLQRFIVRRILVNKINSGSEPGFLKEIPKGSFLTLVVRIDAEWDPFRIPLRTMIAKSDNGSNGMFFTKRQIDVIKGGLENRNFLVQRETARWIVSFYNHNRANNHIGSPGSDEYAAKFIRAIKFAEARDIVYYERNYVSWTYANDAYSSTKYTTGNTGDADNTISISKGKNVVGIPVGRVAVRIGSFADKDIFASIDRDRRVEFHDRYGRAFKDDKDKRDPNKFVEPKAKVENIEGETRRAYRNLRDAREPSVNNINAGDASKPAVKSQWAAGEEK
jgi:hypothetical protein